MSCREESSPELSPRRSWRGSSRPPRDPPHQTPGLAAHSRRRTQRSPATSHSRERRAPGAPGSPTRHSATRGRPTERSTRERSPLAHSSRVRPQRPPVDVPIPTGQERSSGRSPQRKGSESTWTAPSPGSMGLRPISVSPDRSSRAPPPSRKHRSPVIQESRQPSPPRRVRPSPPGDFQQRRSPARTPPRLLPEILELPRTPGHFSSPEQDQGLDLTRMPRPVPSRAPSPSVSEGQWDRFSTVSDETAPAVPPQLPSAEAPLSWTHMVELVYQSGLVDTNSLPRSPVPVRSVIGGPQPAEKRKVALPPAPLAAACLPAAMRSCWGGNWSDSAQHQPPPPNAALHPGPSAWVPDFRARYHAGPGLDLRPARLSAREREWAGTAQPPVDHSWLVDLETMARAQLASLSNLEWLFGIFLDSRARASPLELEAVRGFIARELQLSTNFCGAQIAAATLARRKAILDALQHKLSQTTRSWLQLQPVTLSTASGIFGPVSAQVPEILRQQPLPRDPAPRRRGSRGHGRRQPARDPPAQAPAPAPRQPAATYTPTAAAAPAAPRPQARPRGRGGQQPSGRGSKGAKQQA